MKNESAAGAAFGASAFLIWGLSPLYWKMLQSIPALEIIMHRIVWSFVFLLPIVLLQKRGREMLRVFSEPATLFMLLCTSLFIALNWLIYIWAVNHGHVLQASLGYYINPLVNVLLGMIFLKEQLRPFQKLAVLLAGAGVLCLTLYYGKFPWIALTLAFSFGIYGLIRKMASVGSLTGLTVETLLLSVPAVIYLGSLKIKHTGAFLEMGFRTDLFLMGAALVTALPLLLFTIGTRRLHLSTVGFLQYIAPSCMFLLGIFVYGETFSNIQLLTFCLIWSALILYSADSLLFYKKNAVRQKA
ncbi:MAG: EamA family transporter RarD [Desulfococcaceae bacterium]|jgi:chloramphenicol-sensitive protein RarD|nr:EamA family transporter RarD [Desulfococcaceae bacterium]